MQLKTINIKGKEYVEVNERLKYFRKTYPKYALTSEVLDKSETSILIQATISDEKGRVLATGLAEEEKSSSFINKTSYVENCETSAWGRALANFGIGLDTSVASADEVQNAIKNQDKKSSVSSKTQKVKLEIGDENWAKVLKWVVANKDKGLTAIVKTLQVKYSIPNIVKTEIKKNL